MAEFVSGNASALVVRQSAVCLRGGGQGSVLVFPGCVDHRDQSLCFLAVLITGISPCVSWLTCSSDLMIGTLLAMLPGIWHHRVSAGTGWPGFSILDEISSLICNFCLSVTVPTIF